MFTTLLLASATFLNWEIDQLDTSAVILEDSFDANPGIAVEKKPHTSAIEMVFFIQSMFLAFLLFLQAKQVNYDSNLYVIIME